MLETETMSETLRPRLVRHLQQPHAPFKPEMPHVVGVLPGEGVGPEVVPVAIQLLRILESHSTRRFALKTGGLIAVSYTHLTLPTNREV